MDIVSYPEQVLRRRTEPVKRIDDGVLEVVAALRSTLASSEGVGLAANQIGYPLRLAIVNPTGRKEDELVLVNPEIIQRGGEESSEEGCLSCPGIRAPIVRSNRITVKYLNLEGKECVKEAESLLARVIQHEVDHLDGRLIIDRMDPAAKILHSYTIKSLERAFVARGDSTGREERK